MMRSSHEEQLEISMENMGLPAASARSEAQTSSSSTEGVDMTGRKHVTLIAISFGLLCVLQAVLNISLRLMINTSDWKTADVEASCKNLTDKKNNFDLYFQQGWVYFQTSMYYISSVSHTWDGSRDDCLQRGGDLIVINSKGEQDFVEKINRNIWIGLSNRTTGGMWEWVDGTPLTESYWMPEEPNNYLGKNEDCVEFAFRDPRKGWNDLPCEGQNFWICEKMIAQ